jgi:ABC-type multidrug transport system fused ATPase/permease subunit
VSTGSARATRDRKPAWREHHGEGVTVSAPSGSYAERRAPAELDEAERTLAELRELLGGEVPHVEIVLVDSVPDVTGPAGGERIVRTVAPDRPLEPLALPVSAHFLRHRFGAGVADVPLFHAGIAGLVAIRVEAVPPLEELETMLRQELEQSHPVSIFTLDPRDGLIAVARAASFVSFLIESHGRESFVQLLERFDPTRSDDAAISVYGQPLGRLEERWLENLSREPGNTAAMRTLFGHLLPLIRSNWLRELELAGYTVLDVAFSVAIPLLTARLFGAISKGDTSAVLPFMLLLVGIFLLLTPITLRRTYASVWVSQSILLALQEQVFARLMLLPHSFHARSKVGDLMSRLSADVDRVREGMEVVTRTGIYVLLKGVTALAVMYVVSPVLATLALLSVPLFWVGYFVLSGRLQRASYEVQTRGGEIGTATQEALSAHGVIKAFGLEKRTTDEYRGRLQALFGSVRRLVLLGTSFDASTTMAVTLGQLLVLGVGSWRVTHSDDPSAALADLLSVFLLLPSLFEPSTALAGVGRTIKEAAGSMERVAEVLEEPMAVADAPDATALPPLADEIRLEHVDFSYDGTRPTLRDLNLRIRAGADVAIVGPSGSGKSTVINLLMRFWDPAQGRILFDGRDIREATLASLRGQLGLVFQDTFVFDTSVRENIAIGRATATDAEVEAAARAAELDEYVSTLPAGFDTVLGERGVRMSGGQRQRLAIARALIRNPQILILDEATSALDPETEAEIQETLAEAGRHRTTISITHRLTSAARADHVFVLDRGRLVEEGTHEELMRTGGVYRELYDEQTSTSPTGGRPREVEAARLRVVPLFRDAPAEALAALAERLTSERYDSGEIVVREGDRGDRAYIVVDGQLEVFVAQNGNERQVNVLERGDYFGEMAVLSDEPRAATIRATEPSLLYSLRGEDLAALVEVDPALHEAVSATVAERRAALASAGRGAAA